MIDNFFFRSAVRLAPLRRLQEKLEKPRPVAKTFVVFKTGNKTKVILK